MTPVKKRKTKTPHQWEHMCSDKGILIVISHAIHFCPFCKKKKP